MYVRVYVCELTEPSKEPTFMMLLLGNTFNLLGIYVSGYDVNRIKYGRNEGEVQAFQTNAEGFVLESFLRI